MFSLRLNVLLITLISLVFSLTAKASPFPGFSSSDARNYHLLSPWTYKGVSWSLSKADWPHVEYQAPSNVKFENRIKNQILDIQLLSQNSKSSLQVSAKGFTQFGFDVLSTQLSGSIDVIDLYHNEKKRQVRQYVFKNSKVPLSITCSSSRENFSDTVRKCNRIALQLRLPTEPALKLRGHSRNQTQSID